ncbi:hypothetical protein HJC23_001187 [Cyclotella cryptica]|uniref:Uncharacterized protein n=1 Tax=Cyclotella cryptica TaxID=29204 RepID=A0ABD3QRW3_9STRA
MLVRHSMEMTSLNNVHSERGIDLATAIDQSRPQYLDSQRRGGSSCNSSSSDAGHGQEQQNTLFGVLFPSLQSILGVILFLRLTHITSQAGCIYTTILLLISTSSTLFTWSSLSAIVTNGEIKNGGPYYIISRTLGVDIGCSLSILYYIGNSLSGGMIVLGAVEAVQYSIRAYYARWGYGFSGHLFPYDVQVLSFFIVISMAGCVHVGTKYVTLFSNLFLGVTLISVLCMCLGCALFALGLDMENLQAYDRGEWENLWPRYERDPYTGVTPNFFSCLALIYPSVTGILSGLAKSDQLKNPSQSIPKGIFMSIITTSSVYLLVCWLFGMTFSNRILKVDKFISASVSYPHELIVRIGVIVSCMGLLLGHLSTAPNVLAAMSSDNALPFLSFLCPSDEEKTPVRALWLSALLVVLPTLGGNLDHVSPYTTIFYLLMYAGLNAATCISGYVRPPGFRPTFRYFHWSVSFLGFVWCLTLSFFISGIGTFCSMLAFLLFKAYVKKSRRLAATGIKWGTLGSAVRYNIVSSILTSLARHGTNTSSRTEAYVDIGEMHSGPSCSHDGSVLSRINSIREDFCGEDTSEKDEWIHFQPHNEFHAKNWRPQILTIVDVDSRGAPLNFHVLSMAAQLQQTGRGINVVISIIDRSLASTASTVASAVNDICADVHEMENEDDSVTSGLTGPSSDRWRNEGESVSSVTSGMDHYDTIKMIRRTKALLMLEMKKKGMDGFAEVSTTDGKFFEAVWSAVIHTGLGPLSPNTILLSFPSFITPELANDEKELESCIRIVNGVLNLGKAVILFKGSPSYPSSQSETPGRKCIDIWWIVYDGGLLLLLPFLLSKHTVWASEEDISNNQGKNRLRRRKRREEAKLRLFVVTASANDDPEKLRKSVVEHLERMRIKAEVFVIDTLSNTDIAKRMRDSNLVGSSIVNKASTSYSHVKGKTRPLNRVASLVEDGISTHHMTLGEVFLEIPLPEDEGAVQYYGQDLENEISERAHPVDQTASLLNEIIKTHSSDANLVISNLPFIHHDTSPKEYFDFVNAIVEGIENVMLVRGSGAEVVTAIA